MSTIHPIALYQIETFGARIGRKPAGDVPDRGTEDAEKAAGTERHWPRPSTAGPARTCDFLVQLMVGSDSDLRRSLGRRDAAETRESAYGTALARRPSAQPLRFIRIVGAA